MDNNNKIQMISRERMEPRLAAVTVLAEALSHMTRELLIYANTSSSSRQLFMIVRTIWEGYQREINSNREMTRDEFRMIVQLICDDSEGVEKCLEVYDLFTD